MWDETAEVIEVIWVRMESKYFCKWDWTGQITLNRLNKSPPPRVGPRRIGPIQKGPQSLDVRQRVRISRPRNPRYYPPPEIASRCPRRQMA
jgi:hypothetical protein